MFRRINTKEKRKAMEENKWRIKRIRKHTGYVLLKRIFVGNEEE